MEEAYAHLPVSTGWSSLLDFLFPHLPYPVPLDQIPFRTPESVLSLLTTYPRCLLGVGEKEQGREVKALCHLMTSEDPLLQWGEASQA